MTDLSRITPFVTNLDNNVFALIGLPEEVVAVLFAYYSRSPGRLREHLAAMLAEEDIQPATSATFALATDKARAFHEKWVVGYGHASVAEHAVVHLAAEDVSILCAKAIEDARLASYTEKSTRYVVFTSDSFVTPPELSASSRDAYEAACRNLFNTYIKMMPIVTEAVTARSPGASKAAIQAQACDTLRGLLPASTRTNVGITANARALATMITKMASSPLGEVRATAEQMTAAGRVVTPTLLKHVGASTFRAKPKPRVDERVGGAAWLAAPSPSTARIITYQAAALARVALALIDDGDPDVAGNQLNWLRNHPFEAKAIVDEAMAGRGPHDPAPRAFEHATITAELVLDYGAYRDLQRHRLLSPTVPRLTCDLGFKVPDLVRELGLGLAYRAAMIRAAGVWKQLAAEDPHVAQYVVPLGFRVRVLWTLNLRELFHVVELRSAKQGHPSYRRVAQDLYMGAVAVLPWLHDLVRVDLSDYALARA